MDESLHKNLILKIRSQKVRLPHWDTFGVSFRYREQSSKFIEIVTFMPDSFFFISITPLPAGYLPSRGENVLTLAC